MKNPFGFWWWNDDFIEEEGRKKEAILLFKNVACKDRWMINIDKDAHNTSFNFDPYGGENGGGSIIIEGDISTEKNLSSENVHEYPFTLLKLQEEMIPALNISQYGHIQINIKADGRTYCLNAKDNSSSNNNNNNNRLAMIPTKNGMWETIEIKPTDFCQLINGNNIENENNYRNELDYSCISMVIILYLFLIIFISS